ncbi:MAG TPA: hypothetical protein DDY77_02240, partial [Clostridiales bacterium]|nr:hypothetical protein [Clostridiales bacterium]
MSIINKIKHIVIGIACLLLVGIMIVGDFVCKEFYGDISTRLGQRTWTMEEVGDDDGYDATHYTSEYDYNIKEIRKAQEKLATDIQQEGSVILKMGALPMAKTANITLLGAASASGFLYAGSGSGAISSAAMPTLKSVFEDAGYKVNEAMWTYYNTGAGKSRQSASGRRVGESGAPAAGSAAANSVSAYKDYGIVVVGRAGAEATDIPFTTVEDENKHFLELSANEVSLIDYAIANFDNTVILLNTMQPVELSPVLNKNVAIVWIGAAGEKGVKAVPGILNGTLNPSGRLVDTYATKLMNAPSVANQGNFQITNLWSSVNGNRSGNYYVYAEGIYVGYRYYETRYADKVENRAKVGDFNYNNEVDFPFGYGLSYSTFEYSDFDIAESRDKLTAKVTVKNTSEVAGKEVVQIYMQSPYTDFDAQNGIEKSAIELVGFAKTEEIAPGASVTVNVEIPKEYMKVYDSVVNKTYIVEQGDYYFAVGKDSHDALNNVLAKRGFTKSNGMTDDGDANAVDVVKVTALDTKTYSTGEDGKKIENEFANDTINAYDSSFKYLTRSDWVGTMPRPYGGENADATYKGKITAGEK